MGVSLVADAPEHLEGRAVFKEIVDHRGHAQSSPGAYSQCPEENLLYIRTSKPEMGQFQSSIWRVNASSLFY
ncbi:hypothetical protein LINPERHAP1_LOCUS29186 [Linum perenne]